MWVSPNHASTAPTLTTAPSVKQFPSCPAPAPHKLWDFCYRPFPMPYSLLQPSSPPQDLGKGHGAPRGTHLPAMGSVGGRCRTITDPDTEYTLNEISPQVCDTAKLGLTGIGKAKHPPSKMAVPSQAPKPCQAFPKKGPPVHYHFVMHHFILCLKNSGQRIQSSLAAASPDKRSYTRSGSFVSSVAFCKTDFSFHVFWL